MTELIGVLIYTLPLAVILLVANLSERNRARGDDAQGFAIFVYILTAGVQLVFVAGGFLLLIVNWMRLTNPNAAAALDTAAAMELENPQLLAWGVIASGLVGCLLLLPAVRRGLARLLPIQAENVVHAVSLSLSTLILVQLVLTLGVGLANLADMVGETDSGASVFGVWAQAVVFALLGFWGVGWPVRRGIGAAADRLGLSRSTAGGLLSGAALAFVMLGVVVAISALESVLGVGFDGDVEELTDALLGNLFLTPFGIATLGLAAALGEEIVFRGALQPRFGLILTAALFALTHSNYGITLSTLVVFILGLVLGWVRIRWNTVAAMALHATYNILLGTISYLSLEFFDKLNF